MIGRRTRAATATKLIANGGNNVTCAENALPLNDFASPKRKDCRLDMNDANGINVELVKVATNGSNGKRNQRNGKRHMQPITDFFHANGGMSDAVKNELNECKDFSVNTNEFPALPDAKTASTTNGNHFNGHKIDEKYDAPNSPSHRNDEASMIFASPAPKLLNGDTKSNQTTPHRIVAISPTKKQRLYEQNTMAVFSNLNIGSNASSPQMKVKTPKKRPNQRTRRKLMVNGPEHLVQTVITLDNQNNQIDKAEAVNGIKEKKEEVEFKAPIVAPKHVHKTQMTDFFPIRRSVRKTKKAVEQENEQSIQLAIEKQLEDGLIVKSFAEKGRGIIAGKPFKRGEFVVEYIGDLIEQSEADRREEEYAKDANFGCYMYYFKHKEQQWCIDATAESGKLGRLVNHSRNGNLMTKIVPHKNHPHLVLLAKEDIKEGEELTYDYGDRRREALIHHPWLAF